ncbi:MAG: sigma 54-interacting transcriptional regulator [Planctomycetaceae bacterium]|jgi:transcriptional regulator with PAS, ATPase and Fis domain|nr:sigma 54-interacting transcriptional regulator [Planctomycetaceae bacterium]
MSKQIRQSNLPKFFQTLKQPVYVLDSSACLIFCNSELEKWTGCEAKNLIGQRLRYRATTSRLRYEIVAAALAPPPEVFEYILRRNSTVNLANQSGGDNKVESKFDNKIESKIESRIDNKNVVKRIESQKFYATLAIDRINVISRRIAEFIPLEPSGVIVLVDSAEATAAEIKNVQPPELQRQLAAEIHQTLAVFLRRQAGRFRWERMIGGSQLMQKIRRQARLAVDSSATVLIVGEAGTGKEHLATAIHYGNQDAEHPGAIVPIECSVFSEELITSTVYAFRNRFLQEQSARRHTLLLKDADKLPDSLLGTLIDFVNSTPNNQRIIATSTVNPKDWNNHEAIPILLGTIMIELPALRSRREDIPLLAQMFLEEQNRELDRQRAGFTAEAMDIIVQHNWPRNLDELEEMIAEAHANSNATLITPQELPLRLRQSFDAAAKPEKDDKPVNLELFIQQIEKELIERAIKLAKGNKSKAAKLLGLNRPKLYRRMELLKLKIN